MSENLYIWLLSTDNNTKLYGHMKRNLFHFFGLIVVLFTALTMNSCEDVVHEFKGEVTIIDNMGVPMQGVTVTTDVDVQNIHSVNRNEETDSQGKVLFEFDNVAILKVSADKDNYHGEGLLVLVEDELAKVTITVYE
jgi:type I site-specific restriction endonuclease